MRHRVGYNRLSRTPSHRKALHKNMVTSLFRHERITTTKAKARAIRRTAEKMVTRAKVDTVHNRRTIGKLIKDQAVLAKLFTDIGPRFKSRPGGYTRMLKIGQRYGDATEMVILELVERSEEAQERPRRRRRAVEAPESNAGEAPAAEVAASSGVDSETESEPEPAK